MPQVFHRTVPGNGSRIVTEEIPGSRSVSLGVWVGTGSRSESSPENGVAHFIEHLLFKGTTSRTALSLAREIDSVGGHLDAFTGREYTCYYLKVLVEHAERGMDILSDILLRSVFPPHEVERERKVVLEEISMSEDSPEDATYELLVQNIWKKNPLGRPILGTPSTIAAVRRAALMDFQRRYYRSPNLVFAAAGGLRHDTLVDLWTRSFPMPRSKLRMKRHRPPLFTAGFFRTGRDLEQTHLCYGTGGLAQKDHHRYGLYILNSILGGSMSSRLFQEIREKRGLAYSVFSAHSAYRDTGLFTVAVGTSPEMAPRVVRLVRGQLDKICRRPPSKAEVNRAREHIKGGLVLGLESTSSRMMSLAKDELYFGRPFSIEDIIAGLEKVTPQSVHLLARRLFQAGDGAWAAVGPERSLEKISRVLQ